MLEPISVLGAIASGASCAVAVVAIGERTKGIDAATWLQRRRQSAGPPAAESPEPWSKALVITGIRARLADVVDRAGWKESPERLSAFAVGVSACLAVIGASSSAIVPGTSPAAFGAIGLAGGLGICALVLRTAIASRRRRLAAELVPLLELFTLELSGGGSAQSALGSVTTKLQGSWRPTFADF